jgi:hypothetical protein
MSMFLGPLDSAGRVPSQQQTRVAAFLISAHGALARQLAVALPGQHRPGWQGELNAQLHRELEIVSLLFRATAWKPDPVLLFLVPTWEAAWIPAPVTGVSDVIDALAIDLAALGHAVHGVIRPAALLPIDAQAEDPFVQALRRIEFESGRLVQAQIAFLKSPDLLPVRETVNSAVERRHLQVRALWNEMLQSIGIKTVSPPL